MPANPKPVALSLFTVLLTILLAVSQSACIVVGGYRSRGGWFVWPGGFGLLIMIIILFLLFGRR